jgi:hypothetical protein
LQNLILVTSSNRGAEKHTARLFAALEAAGAAHVKQDGSPDVAFARCMALTAACAVLRARPEREAVLMMDDDMICPVETLRELVQRAVDSGKACSAVYATQSGHLAATRWKVGGEQKRDVDGRMLWLVGLGAVAIPRELLLEVDDALPKFTYRGQRLTAFCGSYAEDGEWWGEDYDLSRNLGGVRLEPLGVGHIKKTPLWPDGETLQLIANETELPPDDDASHVRHLDELFPGEEAPLPKVTG